jgi:uncharacterized protein YeaO (DUF488 family)
VSRSGAEGADDPVGDGLPTRYGLQASGVVMAERVPRIRLKRAYEPAAAADGPRILVERLWPRAVSKAAAAIDHWAKEIAPSPALRQWYGHDPARWDEFRVRYRRELERNRSAVELLRRRIGSARVTFVFAAKDEERNSATVLRDHLMGVGGRPSRRSTSRSRVTRRK